MIIAVMIFGLGGPIVSAGAPKVVVSLFEGSARGLAMGIYMTGPAIGGIVSLTATHPLLMPLMMLLLLMPLTMMLLLLMLNRLYHHI